MKLIKNKKIISFVILVFLFFCVLAPATLAQECIPTAENHNCYGLKGDQGTMSAGTDAKLGAVLKYGDISSIIGKIVGSLLAFIGVIFFVLIIYGGFMWMTAQGNEEQVNKAIEMMKQAVFGMIVVAAAYLITKFVGETVINAF